MWICAQVALQRSDWHFVLIGDADLSVDLGKYRSIPNMHFLGRKRYEELPAYCRHFDVGFIPFKINELTRAVNPIKLREHLAAGLPVVSTPMPEVKPYKHLIETANSTEEFEAAGEECLTTTESHRTSQLVAMAKEIWPAKVSSISIALVNRGYQVD